MEKREAWARDVLSRATLPLLTPEDALDGLFLWELESLTSSLLKRPSPPFPLRPATRREVWDEIRTIPDSPITQNLRAASVWSSRGRATSKKADRPKDDEDKTAHRSRMRTNKVDAARFMRMPSRAALKAATAIGQITARFPKASSRIRGGVVKGTASIITKLIPEQRQILVQFFLRSAQALLELDTLPDSTDVDGLGRYILFRTFTVTDFDAQAAVRLFEAIENDPWICPAQAIHWGFRDRLAGDYERKERPSDDIDVSLLCYAVVCDYLTTDGHAAQTYRSLKPRNVRGKVFSRKQLGKMLDEIEKTLRAS